MKGEGRGRGLGGLTRLLMVAAPMLFTTATASSTTKMTTSRDAIVECDLISVEGESYGKEANVFRTMLPKLERGLEVVERA